MGLIRVPCGYNHFPYDLGVPSQPHVFPCLGLLSCLGFIQIHLRILRVFMYTVYTHLYKYTYMYIYYIRTYEIDV